jgi:uncharacterized protein YegP (UPF0339 family)
MGPTQLQCRVYRDGAGEWRWRWRAPNGRIVADSGEGYGSYAAARHAAEQVAGAHVQMLSPQLVRRGRRADSAGLASVLAAPRTPR